MLYVSDVLSAGEIEILGPKIHAGTGTRASCGNNVTSCGDSGHCVDLTGMVYCVRGRVIRSKCLSNNIRNETLTTSCEGGDFRLDIEDMDEHDNSANITLYSKDSSDVIGKSSITGSGIINSLDNLVDMEFDLNGSEFNFLIKGVDLINLETDSNFTIDKVLAVIPGVNVFKTFYVKLPSNFNFSSILLKIKYSDLTINENEIKLYKCSNFNISGTCNGDWQEIPLIRDSTKKIIIAEVSSFSAYALGDPIETTTTTTTTVTTTTTTIPTTPTTISTPVTTTTTTIPTNSNQTSDSNLSEPPSTTTTTIETGEPNDQTVEEPVEKSNAITGFLSVASNYLFIVPPIAGAVGSLVFVVSKQRNNGYARGYYVKANKRKSGRFNRKKVGKESNLILHL
jgi:hypothetical protein